MLTALIRRKPAGSPKDVLTIRFLTLPKKTGVIAPYVKFWAADLSASIEIRGYPTMHGGDAFQDGIYVFTDVEELSNPALRERVQTLWSRLGRSGGAVRLLNNPARALPR